MFQWQMHQQSSGGSPLLSVKSVRCRLQKAVLSQVYLCFFLSSPWRDRMYTLSHVSKNYLGITDINIEKSVGASTHPCFTPFVIANVSETSPSITDVYHHFGIHTFYKRRELFGGSIFPQQLPQSSPPSGVECLRGLHKDNTQRSVLLYAFSGVVRMHKIMSTLLRFERKSRLGRHVKERTLSMKLVVDFGLIHGNAYTLAVELAALV